MKHPFLSRAAASVLALVLFTAPAAQALTVRQAAELIDEIYVDPVPQSVLDQPTIPAMLEALGDPYTEYFTAQEYADFTASMSDASLVGIGVAFSLTEEGLLVSQVFDGSAAQAGGLQAGDLITAVDGKSVLGPSSDEITSWIQGEEGSQVTITYLRGGKSASVTLTRALLVIPATTSRLIDDHIGYISCTTFGAETLGHFEEALETYGSKATVWIVDLRSNTGGHTDAATESAGLFTGPGQMSFLRDGAGEYGAYVREDPAATLYPVIVLMDQYSASASEIFASAIRDRGAGIVVGTRSYGKGVAQTVLDQDYLPEYFPDGDAIKITSHRFFSPAGNTTDQVGVIPNLLVDEDYIADVAYLLAGPDPRGNTKNTLRLDLDWQFYIDWELATGDEFRESFQVLLDAVPDNKAFRRGMADGTWQQVSASEVAQEAGLEYNAPLFPDHGDSHYYTPLSVLKTYGLIKGKGDGLFHPQDTLSRAELCQLLAVALNCSVPANPSPFSDVAESAWYKPAVTVMSNMGLVQGTGNGLFRPEEPVDHQQFITIMARLAQRLNLSFYDAAQEMPPEAVRIVGVMDYADWAKSSVWLMGYSQTGYFGNTLSYLWADSDKIDPTAATTRDEAICTLYKLLSYTGILPA